MNTRVNPATDVFVVDNVRVHPMDPTGFEVVKPGSPLGWSRIGSKMGIDATKPPLSEPDERSQFEDQAHQHRQDKEGRLFIKRA